MKILTGMLAGVVMLIASAAQAAVFRCERAGRLVFTDVACHVGAVPEQIRPVNVMDTKAGLALARLYDLRIERGRQRRSGAEDEWQESFSARKEKETRVRHGRVQGRVVEGMTPAQVRQLLGEPEQMSRAAEGKSENERWTYQQDDGSRHTVVFSAGEVTSVRSGQSQKSRKRKR